MAKRKKVTEMLYFLSFTVYNAHRRARLTWRYEKKDDRGSCVGRWPLARFQAIESQHCFLFGAWVYVSIYGGRHETRMQI